MSHELLLKHINGATSQAPISVDDLVAKTGLLPDTIIALLDQMHHQVPASINKVKITSAGKTSIVCWPTGQIQRFSYAQTNTALHKVIIPREPANKNIAHRTLRRQPMKSSEKTVELVKLVIENPGIRIDTLAETISGAKRGTAPYQTVYARINYALQQNILIKDGKALSLGTNETWHAQHGILDQPRASLKDQLKTVSDTHDKTINTELVKVISETTQPAQPPAAQEYEIPAFLKKKPETPKPAKPKETSTYGQGILFDGIMSLCATLPDYSSITIKVDKKGDHEVLLELDDGDQLFRFNDDIFAVQKVIDAYNVLQQFKDAS